MRAPPVGSSVRSTQSPVTSPKREDVVQDAFAQAWVHRAELDTARSPEAWVRTVAMRRAVSRWRRQRNALVAWSRRRDRDSYETHDPFDPALVKALAELPPAQRLVLVLHHVADLPVATIAAEPGFRREQSRRACPVVVPLSRHGLASWSTRRNMSSQPPRRTTSPSVCAPSHGTRPNIPPCPGRGA